MIRPIGCSDHSTPINLAASSQSFFGSAGIYAGDLVASLSKSEQTFWVNLIRRHGLLSPGDRILVAVSGGPDSVALLHVLHELRGDFDLHLEVAHLQHGIRDEEGKEDARFVRQLAASLNLPFHLREVDLPRMKLSTGKGNLEELARRARYGFFSEVAAERDLQKIATAHTLDDQAETAFMWFLRGAGLKGLGGMAPLARTPGETGEGPALIRPFLEVSKAEILKYLEDRRLDFRVDSTNQDPALLRNWLRLDLLPKIHGRLDMQITRRLGQQAEIFRDEEDLLDRLARDCFAGVRTADSLDRLALLTQPRALQRRILRLWIEQARGHLRGLEFVHIEDSLRLIAGEAPQGRVPVPSGWELVREYDRLKIEKQFRHRHAVCYDYPLEIGMVLSIPEAGLELCSERIMVLDGLPKDLMEAVFDTACLTGALSVRNFRRGDRFRPLGMEGRKKIKDLFIEKRVPLSIRARWPLLAAGDEIVWIPGYGRSAAGRVSDATKTVLRITARSIQG
jgi:tRNA(Ile)-lysidine synthase